MALSDINFQEQEYQDFLLEIPLGVLGEPQDVLFENNEQQTIVMEINPISTGGNIFIMSE